MSKVKYYDISRLDSTGALYRLAIGERSTGKTFQIKKKAIENYWYNGKQSAYIRRYDEDFKQVHMGKDDTNFFASLIELDLIRTITSDRWSTVVYRQKKWYLANRIYDDKGEFRFEIDPTPFMIGFALTRLEHDKGNDYPNITIIAFDEFLATTEYGYLNNEFMLFMNTISTIVRLRTDVVIYMLGNSINHYCPYFTEFGINNIVKQLKPDDIEVIKYGESGTTLAIEFTDFDKKQKKSNIYFAFNNPQLQMIRGDGSGWQMELYPHLMTEYTKSDILYTFFICFNGETYQCEVINKNTQVFIYVHKKTTPLKKSNKDLIYSLDYDPRRNYRRKITKPFTELEKKIYRLFAMDKVFYQDNEVGEAIANYINECK